MRNIKKVKKKIIIICSMLIGIITIMPFRLVKADNMTWEYMYYHTSNSIRATCSGYRETQPNYYIYDNTSNTKYREVIYVDFGKLVSGSFSLGISQMARGDVILTENCVITSNVGSTNNTTNITFSVNGVRTCRIEVYSSSSARGLVSFNGNWSEYVSPETSAINDVNTTLGQIKGYVDGIETSLSNIYSKMGTIEGYVDQIENYIDGVEGLLTTIGNKLDNISNVLNSIYSSVNTSNLNDILLKAPIWQLSAIQWAYNNSYQTSNNYPYLYKGMPCFTYYTNANDGLFTPSKAFQVEAHTKVVLIVGSIYSVHAGNCGIYYNVSDTTNINKYFYATVSSVENSFYLDVITVENNSNQLIQAEIELTQNRTLIPLYLGKDINIPDEIYTLLGQEYNNTYTRKLDLINNSVNSLTQYIDGLEGYVDNVESLLTDIKNGINDISYVNNNTQTVIDNNVNNYNNYTTDIHNIENNYINQFNTYQENITTPSLPNAITNSITSYKSFIDGFFTGVPYVKTILSVILFCFLIICLLGV